MSPLILTLMLTVLAAATNAQAPSPVRVWQGILTLPSYDEGPPDPNPPFDAFSTPGRPNYPYTIRDQLSDRRVSRAWRAIFLENEYLKCSVLPDLGGHLYSCTDKVNGQEMFYANSSIKLSNIAYRGSWAAFGIEFNFPVSHNWMTTSPVDFAWAQNADGSASVWVENIDRVYGMQWRVRLTLRPGRGVLEQHTTLYNRSDFRRRFYWWTNAGVRVWDDSRILYPQKFTASHGFTLIDTWPIDQQGTDNAVLKNQIYGPVSRFSYGSREPFMAVYHPRTKAGIVHYSSPTDAPAKKFWSWGVDADALDWRRALSDDSSAYVEIQAGLFRDQETYGFMEPHDHVDFTEYWLPIRDLDGLTRATPDAAIRLSREQGDSSAMIDVSLNVTRAFPNARIELRDGARVLQGESVALDPRSTLRRRWRVAAGSPGLTFELSDGQTTVLRHTENHFDFVPDSSVKVGPQLARQLPPPDKRSPGEWYDDGETRERNGDYLGALVSYKRGHALEPDNSALLRASGRLSVALRRYTDANTVLTRANILSPSDHEVAYYLALARLELGDTLGARTLLEFAQQYGRTRAGAALTLASLDAHRGDYAGGYRRLAPIVDREPNAERLRAAAAILADTVKLPNAAALLEAALANDPASSLLRYQGVRRGVIDDDLARHLAGDPERILTIAVEYMRLARYDVARQVLSHNYPTQGVLAERGAPHPSVYPLVAYYRAYVKERLGVNADADYSAAAKMPASYVFPNRVEDARVLTRAISRNQGDALAWHLLGSLSIAAGDTAGAIAAWEKARVLQPTLSSLLRNLGYAYLLRSDTARARQAFQDGVRFDSLNAGVWFGLDSIMQLGNATAAERAQSLERFPLKADMPTAMVYRLATLLARAGRFEDAELQLKRSFFARVEGGTNVRGVWLDVRVTRAEALAKESKCREARAIMDGLGRPVAGFPFTKDGLEPFLTRGMIAGRVVQLGQRCANSPNR